MRVTSRMMVEDSIQYMNDSLERLSQLQTRVASGKMIQTPADDPTVAVAGLSLRSTLQSNQAYIDTGYVVRDWLTATELALKEAVDLGRNAQTLASAGVSDTFSADERLALADDIDAMLQHLTGVGNSVHKGKYLFAGFKVTTEPFTYTGAGVTNNLASTADQMQLSIAPGQTLTINTDGNAVFTPLFGALTNVRDALRANDRTALEPALSTLATAVEGAIAARTTNGARQRQLDTEMDRLDQLKTALKSLLSNKEDANLAESISMLKQQETVYQAVLQAGARAVTPTLFDFLR